MAKSCENNGCSNLITVPSVDCPGQCLQCAIESRERVRAGLDAAHKERNGRPNSTTDILAEEDLDDAEMQKDLTVITPYNGGKPKNTP